MENTQKYTEIDTKSRKLVAKKPASGPSGRPSGHIHFTKRILEDLPSPPASEHSTRAVYHDDEVRGLCLAVAPTGRKVFMLYRKVNGKPEKVTLGVFPDLTVDEARGKASELNGAIAKGQNPAAARREVRDEMTLEELFQTWLTLYAKSNKRTWDSDVWAFNKYLHGWRLRRLSSIQKPDVVKLHAHLGSTHGRTTANRIVELLSAMFARAGNDWGWTGKNPAERVKAFRENKRTRFMDGDELPAFFEALAKEPNRDMRDFFLVALLTGARRSNVQAMRWTEINWTRATWSVRAEDSKNAEALTIVLTPPAIRILEMRKASSMSKFVFPGTGRTGHLVEPKKAWGRILKRAGLRDLHMHDLRRTLGSWEAATGASLPIIGKTLGHESIEATKVYARLNLDPVRACVEKATGAMLVAGKAAGLLTE